MSGLTDSALFAAVLDAAVRGTFILLAALAATALMRRRSASARHLVWLAALTALLLLPLARGFVPEWRVLPAAPVVFAAPVAVPAAAPGDEVSASPGSASTESAPQAALPSVPNDVARTPVRAPVDWTALALIAWTAGAALLALRLAYGLLRVWWIERRAVELTDDGWVRLTDGLARRLGLGRIVRLLREPGATVPMTWGIFRPVILLPGEADAWQDERRRVVLAHELAHVRRWDALTQWIAHVAVAVWWFNPLVWVAARRLREEREHACDDAVLEIGTRPAEYADHLLNIVRSLGSSNGTATAALAMARRSQFEGRLLAILDNAVRRNGVSRAAGLATVAAALACLVPLAALRPAVAATVEPASAPSAGVSVVSAVTTTESVAQTTVHQSAEADAAARVEDARALAVRRDSLAASLRTRRSVMGDGADRDARLLLTGAVEGGDPGLYAEIIRSSLDIKSATERRLVLARLLEQPDLSPANVVDIVAATRTMDSDLERRLVLTTAMGHRAFPATSVPGVMLESLRGFDSGLEQRIVITSLVERRRLDTRSLAALLRVVPDIDSDLERRLVLSAIASRQRVDGAARDAYLAAARSISSETERALALNALLEPAAAASPRPVAAASGPGRPTSASSSAGADREPRGGESLWNSSHEVDLTQNGRRHVVRVLVKDAIIQGERWNVRGFRRGGSLLIEEQANGRTRRVEASCDGAGNPVWTYTVDRERRAFDASARAWMESVIRQSSSS
ncbi:M56 family metallopeptidase [Longimicrobium sp.]|uniref:M56 family metallopeptidase n=1 Tax=Longimicrobium sp. TaxID=2029185 RepID=UPI002E34ACF2|nr:M56 family metallopeptidase [Longimicrobium sp.]HEX6038318.1 M56 family metallopeptidase [Longimicrobium sp.]